MARAYRKPLAASAVHLTDLARPINGATVRGIRSGPLAMRPAVHSQPPKWLLPGTAAPAFGAVAAAQRLSASTAASLSGSGRLKP